MNAPLRLGVLVSGGGRTMLNLADRIDAGTLPATIEMVISSRREAQAVKRAKQRGLKVRVAARHNFATDDAMHDVIDAWLQEASVDLVCLCGYLRWFRCGAAWVNRAMNIHPALLPDHGGPGMYGLRVHRAVLASGAGVTGCTVHFVDDTYDYGPIILKRTCPVLPGDDEERLAARVFELECEAYPEAIRLFAAGRLRVEGGSVRILPPAAVH